MTAAVFRGCGHQLIEASICPRGYGLGAFRIAVDTVAAGIIDLAIMITDRAGFDALPAAFAALRHRTNRCKLLSAPGTRGKLQTYLRKQRRL